MAALAIEAAYCYLGFWGFQILDEQVREERLPSRRITQRFYPGAASSANTVSLNPVPVNSTHLGRPSNADTNTGDAHTNTILEHCVYWARLARDGGRRRAADSRPVLIGGG
jgi:hypothetical protein